MLEGVDRLRKLLGLRVGRAQEVPGVGIVGIDLGDVLETRRSTACGLADVFRSSPRLYQACGSFGSCLSASSSAALASSTFCRFRQATPRFRRAIAECRDQLAAAALKCFKRLFEQLLVHVGDAKIVQAGGFDGIGLGCGSATGPGQRQRWQSEQTKFAGSSRYEFNHRANVQQLKPPIAGATAKRHEARSASAMFGERSPAAWCVAAGDFGYTRVDDHPFAFLHRHRLLPHSTFASLSTCPLGHCISTASAFVCEPSPKVSTSSLCDR